MSPMESRITRHGSVTGVRHREPIHRPAGPRPRRSDRAPEPFTRARYDRDRTR